MNNLNFTEFDSNIDEIIPNIREKEKILLKEEISNYLSSYINDPKSHEEAIKIQKRIRSIEEKALYKLKGIETVSLNKGKTCYFCGRYESDVVHFFEISRDHAICDSCIILFKQVIDAKTKKKL